MNWMGGARNRVKLQNERKAQKEFFERKRLNVGKSLLPSKQTLPGKRKLSQDLIALHTVSTLHARLPFPGVERKPIRKIDLDRFKSCTKHFQEVDMGPVSPTYGPSKLLFMDCKGDNTKHKVTTNAGTDNQFSTVPSGFTSDTFSSHPEKDKHNQTEAWKQPDTSTFVFRHRQNDYLPGTIQRNPTFDPIVSEKFQMTPLVSYESSRSNKPIKRGERRRHGINHSTGKSLSANDHTSSGFGPYTSTPFDKELTSQWKNKGTFKETLDFKLSPIRIFNKDSHEGKRKKYKHAETYSQLSSFGELSHESVLPESFEMEKTPILYDNYNNKEERRTKSGKQHSIDSFMDYHTSTSSTYTESPAHYDMLNISGGCTAYSNPKRQKADSSSMNLSRTPGMSRTNQSQGHSGLSLYKHATVRRSPFVHGETPTRRAIDTQVVREQTPNLDCVKCSYGTPVKLQMGKPSFDVSGEIHNFMPYKKVCHSNQVTPQKQPNIMNLYGELGERTNTKTPTCQGGYSFSQRSPKVGEEFPSYLQKRNKKITDMSISDLDKSTDKDDTTAFEVSSERKIHKTDMTDVLEEMTQMEKEEGVLKEASQDRNERLSNLIILTDISDGISFEADQFIKSEHHEVMNDTQLEDMLTEDKPEDLEIVYTAVPLKITQSLGPNPSTVDKSYTEQQKQTQEHEENLGRDFKIDELSKLQMESVIETENENLSNCGKGDHSVASLTYRKDPSEKSTNQEHSSTNAVATSRNNNSNKDINLSKHEEKQKINDCGDIQTTAALPTVKPGTNVQDPEVSSGKNPAIRCEIKPSKVNRGTSPIILLCTREFVDMGVQCDVHWVEE